MREKTIKLLTVKEKGADGFSVYPTHVEVDLDQETYDKFERDAKRFGMTIDEALGQAVYTLVKSGLP